MSATNFKPTHPSRVKNVTVMDHLDLNNNMFAKELLIKYGDNYPNPEHIQYSTSLIKINKRNKKQERILILTNKAMYNVKAKSMSSLQRRIDLRDIASITSSTTSLEFTINIPTQYDYRYIANNQKQKKEIIRIINNTFNNISKIKLNIHKISQSSTVAYTVHRNVAQLTSRVDRHKRRNALMSRAVDPQTTQRIKSLPSKLHDNLLCYGYIRQEIEYEFNKYIPPHLYPLILQYFYITFSFTDFYVVKCIGRGYPGKLLKIEEINPYVRQKKYYLMKIVKKKDILTKYIKLRIMENKRIFELIGQHPYIQSLCYAFQTKKQLFTVYQFINGIELFYALKKNQKFNESITKIWTAEVCLAIGYLHKYGIFNINLKSSNIKLDIDGHCILTDILPLHFNQINGNNIKKPNNTIDTQIEYWAPERIRYDNNNQAGSTLITKAVDWWSVGVLLYELSVGFPPFYSKNLNEMYHKILNAPLTFPNSVPPPPRPSSHPCLKQSITFTSTHRPNSYQNQNKFNMKNKPTILRSQSHQMVSRGFQDITMKLLNRNINKRLGSGPNDIKDIMRHPFFKEVHWYNLKKREVTVNKSLHLLPKLNSGYFTNMDDNPKDMCHIIKGDDYDYRNDKAFLEYTNFP